MRSFRSLLCFFLLLTCIPSPGMSLAQVEKGAAQLSVMDDKETRQEAVLLLGYFWGFYHAIDHSGMTVKVKGTATPATYQMPEWMNDPKRVGASLLDFMLQRTPPGYDLSKHYAGDMMTAWFLQNCKNPDYHSALAVAVLLTQTFGDHYPGSDKDFSVAAKLAPQGLKEDLEADGQKPLPPASPAPAKKKKKG